MIEYSNKDKKLKLSLFVSIYDCKFGLHNFIGTNVSLSNSSLGDYSYVHSNSQISNVIIGKFCSIGMNVQMGLAKHPTKFVSTHPSFYSNNKEFKTFADKMYFQEYGNIIIENDVWIGNNAIIMDGIKIGNGSIISTGSIVTKDVLPYSIVGGVPAKIIKFRFSEDLIAKLLHIQWWNKTQEWLQSNYKYFHDINNFVEFMKQNE
jgi:acetyltransferase-like isoleucine patch superfamily enzyme